MNIFNTVNANEIKEIHVTGKRWFQRSYGNTYHSVNVAAVVSRETANRLDPIAYPITQRNSDVWIDLGYVGFAYGYDRGFEQTALSILIEAVSDAPQEWKQNSYACQVATALNVPYTESVYDVSRKKDL
ncbi:MAG: hypothetical protein ACRC8W_06020 [Plesiomonas shigelloides]